MHPSEIVSMSQLESKHWWYRALHHKTYRQMKQFQIPAHAKILDAGCGTGGLMTYLIKKGYQNIEGYDYSSLAIDICFNKTLMVQQADHRDMGAMYAPASKDLVIANDTLYFLDHTEQRKFLQTVHDILTPGGLLFINLPAGKMFSGHHDKVVGISERTNQSLFNKLISPTHYQITHQSYWPFLVSPLIALIRGFQRTFMKQHEGRSDLKMPSEIMNRTIEWATIHEHRLPGYGSFGSSLFTTLKKL